MKLGYALTLSSEARLKKICDETVYMEIVEPNASQFLDVIKAHQGKQIVIVSLKELSLQLVQMFPIFEWLHRQQQTLQVLDKGYLADLSDQAYQNFFHELSRSEKRAIVRRTQQGIALAVAKGTRIGRPSIPQEKIEQIQYLARSQKRTMREIAIACDVSVGTVYKYVNESRADQIKELV